MMQSWLHLLQQLLKFEKQGSPEGSRVKIHQCQELKDAVSRLRVVLLYKPHQPFLLCCYADDVAFGAALEQYDMVAGKTFLISAALKILHGHKRSVLPGRRLPCYCVRFL